MRTGTTVMKIAAACAVMMFPTVVCAAWADTLQNAYGAVGGYLQLQGGGLASFHALCPKSIDTRWEYVASALFVPISPTDTAALINTGHCNGGNGSGQYLVLNRGGAARVLTEAGVGDMSFLATNMYFLDNTLTLYGNRWLPSDAHCCPSKKANLEFNLKTGDRKLTILNDDN